MMLTLREALRSTLDGWDADLPADWRLALGSMPATFDRVDPALDFEIWEPVFPVRRGKHFPGQPAGAHMLRAFDGVGPASVRCVVLGQDPYPEPGFATGRAFEAGNVASWAELDKMFSKSIRAYMQLIAAARLGREDLSADFGKWPQVRTLLDDPKAGFEPPDAIADRWVGEGVLLLNASLTLSRFAVSIDPHQARGHLPFWQPLMLRLLEVLRDRQKPLSVICFGSAAAETIGQAGMVEGENGHVHVVLREHPAFADAVLGKPNPFLLTNAFLEARGAGSVAW
jgi:uracil-DNA glycosylase